MAKNDDFVFDPEWNDNVDIPWASMTMSQKRRYKANYFFNIYAQKCIEDAREIPGQLEGIQTRNIDTKEYMKRRDVTWIQWEFNRTQRASMRIMKPHIRDVFGMDIRTLPREIQLGPDSPEDRHSDADSANLIATLPDLERKTLRMIGEYLTRFHTVSDVTKKQITALPLRREDKGGYIEATEVKDIYSTLATQLEDIYKDFLNDSRHYR